MPSAGQPFSAAVKGELARIGSRKACCRQAELAGLVRTCGSLEFSGHGQMAVRFATDHGPVARKILQLVRREWGLAVQVTVKRRRRLRKGLTFEIRVPPQPGLAERLRAAGALGGTYGLGSELPSPVAERACCARAYLRGAFMGSGWVSDPERSHHLELVTPVTEHADGISQLCFRFDLPARISSRKDSLVVYIKGAEFIARFLGLVGAQEHVLRFEDVRVLKEMRNRVNRQVNADTANLSKTVDASARQVELIHSLERQGRLAHLPPSLRELAELRLRHPEASLKELGDLCRPQISKSGANHRMRQITRLAAADGPGAAGVAVTADTNAAVADGEGADDPV